MAETISNRPPASGNWPVKQPSVGDRKTAPRPRAARAATLEERLEAKARQADQTAFSGPDLGEMSVEERHKLLYGG